MIFVQDKDRRHSYSEVSEDLDRKLPNGLMGRGGPIELLSRSTDLTHCDFFL